MSYIIYSKLPPKALLNSISDKIEPGYFFIGNSKKNAKRYGGYVSDTGFKINRNLKPHGQPIIIIGVVEPYEQGSKIIITSKLFLLSKLVFLMFLTIPWIITFIMSYLLIKTSEFNPVIIVPIFFSIFFTFLAVILHPMIRNQKYWLKDLIDY